MGVISEGDILSHPRKVLYASEEYSEKVFGLRVTLVWYPFWMFLFILKNPPSQVPGRDYDAVETERFNLCEWQYLGCNRAYLTAFSFVLMRLYFASFLGSLTSHTLSLLACQKEL